MSERAQNIKISSRAWELLRWAKFELDAKSYNEVIVLLNKKIQNRSKSMKKSLKNFNEGRHRIKVKTPKNDEEYSIILDKPKTILLRPEARKILNRLKLESNKPAYTFSDGIEFIIKGNKEIWKAIPERLKE